MRGSTTPKAAAVSTLEFTAIVGLCMASASISTDVMLPGLSQIAADLTPSDLNRAQLVITTFFLGMGAGTLIFGPLADRFGRRPTMAWSGLLFVLSAVLATVAQSLEILLVARFLQGVGASGPRTIVIAAVRDLYSGSQMARIISFAMIVFALVPAIAPSIGALVLHFASWRAIFLMMVMFGFVAVAWYLFRLPETLAKEDVRPIRITVIASAFREVALHPAVRRTVLVQAICMTTLFAALAVTQQTFSQTFDREESFPLWFAMMAVCAASASFLNSQLVRRFGLRQVVLCTLSAFVAISGIYVLLETSQSLSIDLLFAAFVVWNTAVFMVASLCNANLTSLALAPLGHMAGTATSVLASITFAGASILAIPIGQSFDGTPAPVVFWLLICAIVGVALMYWDIRAAASATPAPG